MNKFADIFWIKFVSILCVCGSVSTSTMADNSKLSSDDLEQLATTLEAELNNNLHSELGNEPNLMTVVCVPARWVSTKIPEFRGFKIYTKEIKTKISPEIKCNVEAATYSVGDVRVTAMPESMSLEVIVPSQTRIKINGQGEIGRSIVDYSESNLLTKISFNISTQEDQKSEISKTVSHNWSTPNQTSLLGAINVNAENVAIPSLERLATEIETQLQAELHP